MCELALNQISVDDIDESENELRSELIQEKFTELVDSIRKIGIFQPLLLTKRGERYDIVCGHRRYLAAKALGLAVVPAIILPGDAKDHLVETVHENMVREDVNSMDLATYLDKLRIEKGLTNEALSKMFGKSAAWAGHYLALLRCDPAIQQAVAVGKVDVLSARRLQTIKRPDVRSSLLGFVIKSGASQATIKGWVDREKANEGGVDGRADPESEETEETAEPEYKFECCWCAEMYPMDEQISLPFCGICFQQFKEAVKLEERKEDTANGQEAEVDQTKIEPEIPADGKSSSNGGA